MRMYKVGKKVGVFRFNPQTNEDKIESGRIVARRLAYEGEFLASIPIGQYMP